MGFAHGYHHEKDGVGLAPEDDFRPVALLLRLLSRSRGEGRVDSEAARKIVAQWIVEACERETPRPRFPDFPAAASRLSHRSQRCTNIFCGVASR